MRSVLPYIVLAVLAGFCLPTQAGINARLAMWSRSYIWAAAISFAVGTVALVVYAALLQVPRPPIATAGGQPWWVWTGGFLGAFLVASTVILAPRLGSASMVALIVAGQMLASVVLDHYGLLGYSEHPVSWLRLFGMLLLVGGVALIQLF